MSTTPDDPVLEEDLEPSEPESRGTGAPLPQFPQSRRSTSPRATEPHPPSPSRLEGEGPLGPGSVAATGRSSPTSTDEDDDEEFVDPKDLHAAVRQVVDISFVLVGQGMGTLEKRAKRLPEVDPRWKPTKEEREFVLEPAGRIVKRHVKAPAAAMDTIDGCLIGVGVGGFALRAYFGVDALGNTEQAQ